MPDQGQDFLVENHGTIYLLHPLSEAAKGWAQEHLPEDAMTWGSAVVVEHRFIGPIIEGIKIEGLSVGYRRGSPERGIGE